MKSAELFWNVIAVYHERTFAFELLMIVIGAALTVWLYRKPGTIFSALMKVYLAISFGWMAVVFFWGMDQSPLSKFFAGPLFALIAALFLVDLFAKKIAFTLPPGGWQRSATMIMFALVLVYPLVSFLLGHRYPRITTPFLPCPLTVFALALLSASLPRVDIKIYVLLLIWAMMALPKVFGLFDVREDAILFFTGIFSLVLLIKRKRVSMKANPSHIPHTCPWWLLPTFDNPLRRLIHDPTKILAGMVKPGNSVLDIGCGMGYFTLTLAEMAGEKGHVIAADLQGQMLAGLRRRAERAGLMPRIQLLVCAPDRIGLDGPVDFALAFWMVHEVRQPEPFLREIYAALKPGGKLLIVEPRIHVPGPAFDRTVILAELIGFHESSRPQVRISRAILLEKSDHPSEKNY